MIHMGYEDGDGMKLRDLARSSGDPKSFTSAFYLLRSRIGNRKTARCSRKLYEFVPKSSSTPHLLTSLQQATMVPVFSVLRLPHHPGPPVTFPTWTHNGNQNFRPRTYHPLASFLQPLIFEQNQREVYREVLIAGDLSKEDIYRAVDEGWFFRPGRTTSDTTELAHDNDTIYFAQPSLSQFVPGGFGAGAFNLSPSASISLKDTPNASAGRNPPKSNTGVVLRYARPTCWRYSLTP